MGYRVSVDVGGTFTDVVAFDELTKKISSIKVSSTLKDQSIGVIKGIKKLADGLGISGEAISYLIHGTTVATNALLERKGAKTALITTEGFRDIMEIGDQTRPNLYNFWAKRPKPPVPRYLTFEVPERTLWDGKVEKKLDEGVAREVTRKLRTCKVESVAISFLNSYTNPSNEKRMKEIILEEISGLYVSISSEVLPEIREYERTSTTVINAYLMPKVNTYINRLERRKIESNIGAQLHVMQSNGGMMSAEVAAERSVHTVFSGPSGGVLAGMHIAKLLGEENVITLDIGGTSADISLIEGGEPSFTTEGKLAGFPIRVPMMEIHTIGAGGGSIGWIDAGGSLRIGPRSAGADPGPACYKMGGDEPTITDAHVVLGQINPEYFAGGELPLFQNLAVSAIERSISRALGLSLVESAEGMIDVANANLCKAIKVVSTERGFDLRDFALIAFGGAGPLHAASLAGELGMKMSVIPPSPGNFSAIGAELADVRYNYVQTRVKSTKGITVDEYNKTYEEERSEAIHDLINEGFKENEIVFEGTSDMRYAGQLWELNVPVPAVISSENDLEQIALKFNEIHKRRYGYNLEDEEVVFVNLRLSAVGKREGLEFFEEPIGERSAKGALKGEREVFSNEQIVKCPLYERERLCSNNRIDGPAIIEEQTATTVVLPENVASIDKFRNIIIK